MRIGRHLPSPALATAIAALVVATGGSAYAITKLPPGSVHGAQLKRNAVTSPKVKNRSLGSRDLGPAAIAALTGPRGDAGAGGQPGTQGLGGSNGGPGPRGPITALASSNAMPVTLGAVPAPVGTLSIPAAGRYEIFGKVVADWLPSSGSLNGNPVTCSMTSSAGGTGDSSSQTLLTDNTFTAKATLALVSWQDVSGPATVTLTCSDAPGSGETVHAVASRVKLAAIKTNTLTDASP